MNLAGCGTAGGPGQGAAATPDPSIKVGSGGPTGLRPSIPSVRSAILPERTPLVIRTTNALSTNTHTAGQVFRAHLEQPVVIGGKEIVPKGTEVEGAIVESDKGGRVKGRATLAVQITRLFTGGRTIEISTDSVRRQARATKAEDAGKIGIGSRIGAGIGAIAGGGRGAAIGAAAGAGAGTGGGASHARQFRRFASESVLHFVLRIPVTVAESRLE